MTRQALRKLVLHIGAHRTATSTFQHHLDKNAAYLSGFGWGVLTPTRISDRKEFSVRNVSNRIAGVCEGAFFKRTKDRRRARRMFDKLLKEIDQPRLVVSDENLLGPIFDEQLNIYPAARCCLGEAKRVLPRDPDIVLLTVRNYATFLPSAYAMRAIYERKFEMQDRESLAEKARHFDRGWRALISDMKLIFGSSQILVVPFEQSHCWQQMASIFGAEICQKMNIDNDLRLNISPGADQLSQAPGLSNTSKAEKDQLLNGTANTKKFVLFDDEVDRILSQRYWNEIAPFVEEEAVLR